MSYSLSTDDPGVIRCSIVDEYILATRIGLSEELIIESVSCLILDVTALKSLFLVTA